MIESKIFYPEQGSVTPETAGQMLSFAREGQDLSVEYVASNLNLGVATIDALERDQYDQLPGYTFVKGYARAYAILLHLNPDEVTERMDLKPEDVGITSKSTQSPQYQVYDRANKPTNKSGGLFFKSVLAIIFLVGVSLFGLNQLSHLDAEKLAVLLKLPIPAKADHAAEDANEILLPQPSNIPQASPAPH